MIINGFLPISDISVQEGVNDSGMDEIDAQRGDFSALLLLNLSTPAARVPQSKEDAEEILAADSSDPGLTPDSADPNNRGLQDTRHYGLDVRSRLGDQVLSNLGLDGSEYQPKTKAIMSFESSTSPLGGVLIKTKTRDDSNPVIEKFLGQNRPDESQNLSNAAASPLKSPHGLGVSPKATAERANDDIVKVPAANYPHENSNRTSTDTSRGLMPRPENSEVEGIAFKESVPEESATDNLAKTLTRAAPKEFIPSNPVAVGTGTDTGVISKNIFETSQLSSQYLGKDGVAELEPLQAAQNSNVTAEHTHVADLGQRPERYRSDVGFSIYARDNLGQAVSAIDREANSARRGGEGLGIQLNAQFEGAPHGRAMSQPASENLGKQSLVAMDLLKAMENSKATAAHPPGADQGQPGQGRGNGVDYSIYAKNNLGQAVSTIARELISPRDGGEKFGRQLHTEADGESPGRTISQLIRTIGETGAMEGNSGERGTLFQQNYHEPEQVTLETAHHSRAQFHFASLANNLPSAPVATEAAPWRPLLEHVVGEIKGHVRIGKSEAVLRLDPPELGNLKIDLHLEGDKLEAHIITETQEARTLIETRLPELRQALSESLANRVEVSIDSGSWSEGRGGGQKGLWDESAGSRQWADNSARTPVESPVKRESQRRQSNAHDKGRVSMWA